MSVASAWTAVTRALSTAPPNDAYIPWNSPGIENPKPSEDEAVKSICLSIVHLQQHNLDQHRQCFRATHVKTQGIVKGTLTVLPDLPEHLRQGMFREPGKQYDVIARYANEPVFLQPDQASGPRGLSMRVFGVEGERLDRKDTDGDTQDWFFNNAPMIELTDVDTCQEIMELREQNFDSPMALSARLKLRRDAWKQSAPGLLPNTNIISHSFYTQSAFRYGDYYGHLALFPSLVSMKTRDYKVKYNDSREVLRHWLAKYFAHNGAKYDFKVQLGTSPEHHPTEDASVVWDEATSPYQTIAIVESPPQESFSPARRAFWEDSMRLSPWSGLAEHRPLGSINRLRRAVYSMSQEKREEENATAAKKVSSIEDIP